MRGEWVAAGAPVVALLPPENIKVRFFVPEARLGAVQRRPGGRDRLRRLRARRSPRTVTFIAPQAEYTPPVIYSRENRAKLVFLVEARPVERRRARSCIPGSPST